MGVKVSVVMPVRNPGQEADAGFRSVLEQSLPADEYEVIIADGGSVPGVAARLDAMAADRPNVQVLHLPRAGWPMRARNAGLAAAQGEYVYLLDQGDRLAAGAARLMYERARIAEADVLAGRIVRDGSLPPAAFQVDRDRADILRDRLLGQLTPHKLYRREFLDRLGLRFDERGGPLAEEAFVLRAYLSAKVVALLAESICCRVAARTRREQRPASAAAELDALLDIVDDHTPPGRQRDRMYAHWFRTVVLRPFSTGRFLSSSQDRSEMYGAMREITVRRFPARLDPLLPVHLRAVAALLRAGRLDRLIVLAGVTKGVGLRVGLREAHWDEGVLTMRLAGELTQPDGDPMWFRVADDRLYWVPPTDIDPVVLPPALTEVGDAVARARLHVYVRHEENGEMYVVPTTSEIHVWGEGDDVRLVLAAEARLDVSTVAVGHPLVKGMWEVHARLQGGAYHARARVTGGRAGGATGRVGVGTDPGHACAGAVAEHPRRLVVPFWCDGGTLHVCVEPRSYAESIALVSPGAAITRRDGHVFVVMPVPYVPPSGGPPVELVLRNGAREVSAPGLVEPGEPGRLAGQLVAKFPARRLPSAGFLGPGAWEPALRADDRETALRFTLDVAVGGAIAVRQAGEAPPVPLMRRLLAGLPGARRAVRGVRRYRF
ncbi:glycosyltransferase [Spongiactinospora sp. TRM90649]|uniref:glycosyltransferase n=1 Tax=Spongiactinospora sp. TRM90649 TaxID=3031114 RepID=UPI0023F9F1E5|nr:glycosyltransferase [Spongiactinospora sp. TRM90649]MDF5754739.1 glycosyltransferase [Spongiactinospora sp. TRM90649]